MIGPAAVPCSPAVRGAAGRGLRMGVAGQAGRLWRPARVAFGVVVTLSARAARAGRAWSPGSWAWADRGPPPAQRERLYRDLYCEVEDVGSSPGGGPGGRGGRGGDEPGVPAAVLAGAAARRPRRAVLRRFSRACWAPPATWSTSCRCRRSTVTRRSATPWARCGWPRRARPSCARRSAGAPARLAAYPVRSAVRLGGYGLLGPCRRRLARRPRPPGPARPLLPPWASPDLPRSPPSSRPPARPLACAPPRRSAGPPGRPHPPSTSRTRRPHAPKAYDHRGPSGSPSSSWTACPSGTAGCVRWTGSGHGRARGVLRRARPQRRGQDHPGGDRRGDAEADSGTVGCSASPRGRATPRCCRGSGCRPRPRRSSPG